MDESTDLGLVVFSQKDAALVMDAYAKSHSDFKIDKLKCIACQIKITPANLGAILPYVSKKQKKGNFYVYCGDNPACLVHYVTNVLGGG